jgi:chromosome segregation ATPase
MADNQLTKNTLKLSEFEKNIQELNSITSNVKTKVDGEIEEIVGLKTDLLNIKNDSDLKLAESNQQITSKIKQQFQSELSQGETQIQQNQQLCEELSKEIDDLYIKISEHDTLANQKIKKYRAKKLEFDDLSRQFNLLKESFNDTANENERLNKTLEERNLKSKTLDVEIEDMNQVIAKLTESRQILNRYFTNHYENFTEEEKKLISEIEGNTLPGYYNNNPVLPEIESNEITNEQNINVNKPNIDLMNISKKNNYGYNNFGNTNNDIMRNTGKILNEEEYSNYQGQLRAKAPPQVSSSVHSQNRFNRNYVGPDDDYWYEKNK